MHIPENWDGRVNHSRAFDVQLYSEFDQALMKPVTNEAEMTEIDEKRNVDAAKVGDIGAFERLYRAHSGRVYGLCLRLCRHETEAQDCAQETFVLAWQRLESFRSESRLGTWLHRIAVNVVLARKRKGTNEARHFTVVTADAEAPLPDPSEIEALEQAIRRLPERTRAVFVLQKVYGYTHEQTSEMLDIAVGTCKAQVHRAMRQLGETLGSENTDRPSSGAPAQTRGWKQT